MAVLSMSGKEGEGQAEGFVLGAGLEELKGVIFIALGNVDWLTVFALKPMLAGLGSAEVVTVCRELAVMPLADMTDVVAVLTQLTRVGLLPRGGEHIKTLAAVTRHPLTGVEAGSTNTTDGGGDTVLGEAHPLLCQGIQAWGFDDGITRSSEGVVTPVIGVEHEDVERLVSCGGKTADCTECNERGYECGFDHQRG